MPYYQRFVAQYPTIRDLACAPENEVLKLWEGLGYYTRARNLHAAAKYVHEVLDGHFPDTYEAIRALKGVGDYTAAAIASFAYDLPYAVVDGNVYRVLSRFFGLDTPVDSTTGKKAFAALAQSLLDPARAGAFNQAMMDFGATQCTPQKPGCNTCPLAARCVALAENRVQDLPVKSKRLVKKERLLVYGVFQLPEERLLIRQRNGRDVWRNLYEFPGIEIAPRSDLGGDARAWAEILWGGSLPEGLMPVRVSRPYRQVLTHQTIQAIFVEFKVDKMTENALFSSDLCQNCIEIPQFKLKKMYPVPRIIDWYWAEKDISLSLF